MLGEMKMFLTVFAGRRNGMTITGGVHILLLELQAVRAKLQGCLMDSTPVSTGLPLAQP